MVSIGGGVADDRSPSQGLDECGFAGQIVVGGRWWEVTGLGVLRHEGDMMPRPTFDARGGKKP